MADIELVIKIPEEAYKLLNNEGVDWLGADHILNAVANGTPLDKLRANIARLKNQNTDLSGYRWWNNAINACLSEIDWFKAESEDNNGSKN